jgi:phage terminase large subunit
MTKVKIECVNKLGVLLTKKKRIKILVGGRASTKSTFVADYVLSRVADFGERWCCSREYQNSIEESVHSLLTDEIERCKFAGFTDTKNRVSHSSGGYTFYKGLARNITSLKSIVAHGLWIEEGESLSESTLKILTASIRASAKDVQEAKEAGIDVPEPEIWITMNRGSKLDPISKRFLARAEKGLATAGYYEDDMVMIVQVNYDENPWFEDSGLEVERQDDWDNMERAMYYHKWHGDYYDGVEGGIINIEWFDACIDAHTVLGFEPVGMILTAHDPSDGGDAKGYAMRHGSVVLDVQEKTDGDVNEGCDWATGLAIEQNADSFTWDCDGMGSALNRQVADAFHGKHTVVFQFKGSEGPEDPEQVYEPATKVDVKHQKKNKQVFKNKRAQNYIRLANRMQRTYQAVTQGKYFDPDTLISFSSDIECLPKLRSELCRIPRKPNANGMIQLYTKPEMKTKFKIDSPNLGDSVMELMMVPETTAEGIDIDFSSEWG